MASRPQNPNFTSSDENVGRASNRNKRHRQTTIWKLYTFCCLRHMLCWKAVKKNCLSLTKFYTRREEIGKNRGASSLRNCLFLAHIWSNFLNSLKAKIKIYFRIISWTWIRGWNPRQEKENCPKRPINLPEKLKDRRVVSLLATRLTYLLPRKKTLICLFEVLDSQCIVTARPTQPLHSAKIPTRKRPSWTPNI